MSIRKANKLKLLSSISKTKFCNKSAFQLTPLQFVSVSVDSQLLFWAPSENIAPASAGCAEKAPAGWSAPTMLIDEWIFSQNFATVQLSAREVRSWNWLPDEKNSLVGRMFRAIWPESTDLGNPILSITEKTFCKFKTVLQELPSIGFDSLISFWLVMTYDCFMFPIN